MNELFSALNQLVKHKEASNVIVSSQMEMLSLAIAATNAPWASEAISQLQSYRQGKNRAVIDTTQSKTRFKTNLIVAEIKQKFGRHLKFEWFYFTDAKSTVQLSKKFPSLSRPIKIEACSPNLELEYQSGIPWVRSVVVFTEDWHFPTKKSVQQLRDWEILYFIDRFRLRSETYSWPILQKALTSSTFPNLRALYNNNPVDFTEKLCSDWVSFHERNHRSGSIPFAITDKNDFRIFKGNKTAGAFEEMRADVNAILELNANASDDGYERCIAEFITLERLFRYPVQYLVQKRLFEFDKSVDYDSIGSQLLFQFLAENGYIMRSKEKVGLGLNYLQGLAEFAALAETIQKEALRIADNTDGCESTKKEAGRKFISEFVENMVNYDSAKNDCSLNPIFKEIADIAVGYSNLSSTKLKT